MDRIAADALLTNNVELFRLRGDEGWYSYLFGSTPEDLPEGEIVIAGLTGDYSASDAKTIDMFHSQGMLRYVETLEVHGWMSNEGLLLFSCLETLRELALDLDLHRNGVNVTDSGVRCLERLSRLERLSLCIEGLGDGAISSIQKLPLLTNLDLSYTKVTDNGVQELATLAGLQVLDLSGTAITDSGLAHLRSVRGLQKLELHHTKITETGIKDFKNALPGCVIHM